MQNRREKFDEQWHTWSALPEGKRKQFILGKALQENMALVKKFVDRLVARSSVYIEREDALQAGCIGFVVAYRKYDPKRPTMFSTMLWPWVRHEVQTAMLHQTQIYRPKGTGMPYDKHNISESVEGHTGRKATAHELGCSDKELAKWESMAFHFVPMDEVREKVNEEDPGTSRRESFFKDHSASAQELLEEHEFDRKMAKALGGLSQIDRQILLEGQVSARRTALIEYMRQALTEDE